MVRSLVLGALTALLMASTAQAAIVSGNFTGTITTGAGTEGGVDFLAGQTVSGTFSYDSASLSALWVTPGVDSYFAGSASPFTVTLTTGGATYTADLSSQLYSYATTTGTWDAGAQATDGSLFGIVANDSGLQVVSDLADPGSVWFSTALTDAGSNGQAWFYFVDGQQSLISLSSLSVTTVPEPLTLALLASGLVGVAGLRRRRAA